MTPHDMSVVVRWLFSIVDMVIICILAYMWYSWYGYYNNLKTQLPSE